MKKCIFRYLDTAGSRGCEGQTEGTSTRHSRKNFCFLTWIQLAVDIVKMRQEAARGGQKVHFRGIRANMYFSLFGYGTAGNGGCEGQTEGTRTRHSRKNLFFFTWIQLAVVVVKMRKEVVSGRQKV